jgi:hypothetical protein
LSAQNGRGENPNHRPYFARPSPADLRPQALQPPAEKTGRLLQGSAAAKKFSRLAKRQKIFYLFLVYYLSYNNLLQLF